mgnify:CR=1 FL=1
MNRRNIPVILGLIAALSAVPLRATAADTYAIDASHTSVVFSVGHAGRHSGRNARMQPQSGMVSFWPGRIGRFPRSFAV